MLKRIIPTLLISNGELVKPRKFQFRKHRYIGDPINAVRIFNDKDVDELILLDISASRMGTPPNFELLENIAGEAFMPMAYGGGISTVSDARRICSYGFEKIIINSAAYSDSNFLNELVEILGSQSVVISIDVKKDIFGKYKLYSQSGGQKQNISLDEHLNLIECKNVGEVMINNIELDGTQLGLDSKLISYVSSKLLIPVIGSGGAKNMDDINQTLAETNVSAVAAGALFTFYGPHQAVLLSYPSDSRNGRYY